MGFFQRGCGRSGLHADIESTRQAASVGGASSGKCVRSERARPICCRETEPFLVFRPFVVLRPPNRSRCVGLHQLCFCALFLFVISMRLVLVRAHRVRACCRFRCRRSSSQTARRMRSWRRSRTSSRTGTFCTASGKRRFFVSASVACLSKRAHLFCFFPDRSHFFHFRLLVGAPHCS